MAGATDTTVAEAIAEHILGVADTADDRSRPMMDYVGEKPSSGGDSVDWKVNSAGNSSSSSFVEGDAPPGAGFQTYYGLTLAKSGYQHRTMIQVTGTAMDSCKGGHFDAINAESVKGVKDHDHYVEGLMVAGFIAAIDSAGSYAGQVRATANIASYEAAVTPSLDEMATMWDTLEADPISMDLSTADFLTDITFVTAYADVATGQTNFPYTAMQGGKIDAGRAGKGIVYNDQGFTKISTMTAGTCLISQKDNFRLTEFRPLSTKVMGATDDSIVIALTSVVIPWVFDPRHAGKLT